MAAPTRLELVVRRFRNTSLTKQLQRHLTTRQQISEPILFKVVLKCCDLFVRTYVKNASNDFNL